MLLSAVTHGDVAVRLDFVDPEALLHQAAGSAQQLFELAQREGPHLGDAAGRVNHSRCETMTTHRSSSSAAENPTTVAAFPFVSHKVKAKFLQFQQGAIVICRCFS